jgi:hypothetical protein
MANMRERQPMPTRESDYIAPSGSSVSSPKEHRARTSWAGGMCFSTLCVRYDMNPAVALRVLGLKREQISESEWFRAELAYNDTKQVINNELRDERGRKQAYQDRCSNPCRGGPRR